MNGPDHYREAERLADAYKKVVVDVEALPCQTEKQAYDRSVAAANAHALLAKAQVHAALAQAAAMVMPFTGSPDPQADADAWSEVLR